EQYSLGSAEFYYGGKTTGMKGLPIVFDSGTYVCRMEYGGEWEKSQHSKTEADPRERKKNEKLKGVKARLDFDGSSRTSLYSESRTISTREHEKRHRSRRSRSPRPTPGVFSRIRCERSRSPRQKSKKKEGGVFKRLGGRGESVSARSDNHNQRSRYTEALSESEDSGGGHWKSRSKGKRSSRKEDDLSQPWGEVAASNHERKKSFPSWKQQEEKAKFKAPPPMTTSIEKRNHAKFCEFHGEVGHITDECLHLKKQIEEMLKAGKLSHLIKELKQNSENEQPKATKKGETSEKDKALAILMVQP
ncbi:hypothetical protein Tco_0781741, partial [Tanacetum coccineum]